MKTKAERSIEALTWAAVIIWLGIALVTHLLGYVWLVVMVLGIILLSSAIYQRSQGWHTSLSLWIAGIWMAVFSVIEIISVFTSALNNGQGLQIDLWVYLGIALVSMGVAVVLRYINFPTINASGSRPRPDQSGAYGPASYIPRQVQEDYSVGYVPPPGQEDYSAGYASASSGGWTPADQGGAGYTADYAPQPQPGAQYPPPQPDRYDPVWNNPAASQPSVRAGRRPGIARPRRTARRVEEPSDLESRVEDIIRRSRERRDTDNLPY